MTIGADRLVEFARRHVLRDDETIEWMKAVGDGTDTPVVALSTAERGLSVRVVRGLLQAERASFVAAVVAVTREDEDFDGPPPREYLLMRHDGTAVRLADAGAVAALGSGCAPVTCRRRRMRSCSCTGSGRAAGRRRSSATRSRGAADIRPVRRCRTSNRCRCD
ncbi:hypothetical protein [Dactylosporangium cerinum]